MSENKERSLTAYIKWLCGLFALLASALILIAALVIWVDPFFHYHDPIEGFPYQIDHQLSQNPGMARHFSYDSVLLGSSMTVNFEADWFRELLGRNLIKLCYNGAYPHDNFNIMREIDASGNTLAHVYWGVDVSSLSADPEETKYPIPEYLYNDSIFDDVEYWYNKDVLLDYILKPIVNHDEPTDLSGIYGSEWWMKDYYGRDRVISQYEIPEKNDAYFPDDMFLEGLRGNLEFNIIPIIENHPETEFTFFFPPVSILYWYNYLQNNQMNAVEAEYRSFIEALLRYDNVEIFFFPTEEEIVCDLDSYADTMHHKKEINRYMAECFQSGKDRIDRDSYSAALERLDRMVRKYDFDALLSSRS